MLTSYNTRAMGNNEQAAFSFYSHIPTITEYTLEEKYVN